MTGGEREQGEGKYKSGVMPGHVRARRREWKAVSDASKIKRGERENEVE